MFCHLLCASSLRTVLELRTTFLLRWHHSSFPWQGKQFWIDTVGSSGDVLVHLISSATAQRNWMVVLNCYGGSVTANSQSVELFVLVPLVSESVVGFSSQPWLCVTEGIWWYTELGRKCRYQGVVEFNGCSWRWGQQQLSQLALSWTVFLPDVFNFEAGLSKIGRI